MTPMWQIWVCPDDHRMQPNPRTPWCSCGAELEPTVVAPVEESEAETKESDAGQSTP